MKAINIIIFDTTDENMKIFQKTVKLYSRINFNSMIFNDITFVNKFWIDKIFLKKDFN